MSVNGSTELTGGSSDNYLHAGSPAITTKFLNINLNNQAILTVNGGNGANGYDGAAGTNGTVGQTVSSACENGHPGSAGTAGGNGSNGSNGADAIVIASGGKLTISGSGTLELVGGNGGAGGNGGVGGVGYSFPAFCG